MTDDMTKRRDELADKRSKRQCTTGNPDLDKAIAWYLKIGFEDGFDAGVAEMQAQIARLEKAVQYSKNCFYSFGADEHLKELELILEGRGC